MKSWTTITITLSVEHPTNYDIATEVQNFINEMCSKMEQYNLDVTYKVTLQNHGQIDN